VETKKITQFLFDLPFKKDNAKWIVEFHLGLMSVFIDKISNYRIFDWEQKKAEEIANNCKGFFVQGPPTKIPDIFTEFIEKINSDRRRKEFCHSAKDTFKDLYFRSNKIGKYGDPQVYATWSKKDVEKLNKSNDDALKYVNLCLSMFGTQSKEVKDQIVREYGSETEFTEQCNFFRNINCDYFQPKTDGFLNFVKGVSRYIKGANNFVQCAAKYVKQEKLAAAFHGRNILDNLLKEQAPVMKRLLQYSKWGRIRGGFYLTDVVYSITSALSSYNHDLAFKEGEVFGKIYRVLFSLEPTGIK